MKPWNAETVTADRPGVSFWCRLLDMYYKIVWNIDMGSLLVGSRTDLVSERLKQPCYKFRYVPS